MLTIRTKLPQAPSRWRPTLRPPRAARPPLRPREPPTEAWRSHSIVVTVSVVYMVSRASKCRDFRGRRGACRPSCQHLVTPLPLEPFRPSSPTVEACPPPPCMLPDPMGLDPLHMVPQGLGPRRRRRQRRTRSTTKHTWHRYAFVRAPPHPHRRSTSLASVRVVAAAVVRRPPRTIGSRPLCVSRMRVPLLTPTCKECT